MLRSRQSSTGCSGINAGIKVSPLSRRDIWGGVRVWWLKFMVKLLHAKMPSVAG